MKAQILSTLVLLGILYLQPSKGLQCPPPDDRVCIHEYDQCHCDEDCLLGYKCCPQPGCGLECKVEGNCPKPDNRVCIQYYDQCLSDEQCLAEKGLGFKCCLQPGCGHECKEAV